MSRQRLLYAALLLSLSTCRKHAHDAASEHGGHGHEHGAHEQEHGHPHADEDGPPSTSVTLYQDGLELFMEYPLLVVGEVSPLVAHFTDTRSDERFVPVTRGSVRALLRYGAGGQEELFVAEQPLRDGIFKPLVRPTRAGTATLRLELDGPQTKGAVDVGEVTIYPALAAAKAAPADPEPDEPTVAFLKEQQWKTEYATAEVQERALMSGVRAHGELGPVPGQAAELAAPVEGRVASGGQVPYVGLVVRRGELLVTLIPLAGLADRASLELEVSRAVAELGLAKRDEQRAAELLAAKALPEKQVDAARVAREVAEAQLDAVQRQLALVRGAQSGSTARAGVASYELRSPIDGVVSFAQVTPGAVVQPGARLVAVVNAETLWLHAQVYEIDAPKVQHSPGASFTVSGSPREFRVGGGVGRVVSVGAVIDAATRTVPVIYEVPNPDAALKPGMYASVTVFTGEAVTGPAIPESALVDDEGQPVAFVMDGGESFFRRRLRLGVRSGGFVQVLDGVTLGERVVSRGAYEIKLSTASGAVPAHGHQH